MNLPTKTQLERLAELRYRIVGAVLTIRHGTENIPEEAGQELLLRIHEAAEEAIAEAGERFTWDDLKRLMAGTLRISLDYLEQKEPVDETSAGRKSAP